MTLTRTPLRRFFFLRAASAGAGCRALAVGSPDRISPLPQAVAASPRLAQAAATATVRMSSMKDSRPSGRLRYGAPPAPCVVDRAIETNRISRRRFLRDAGAVTLVAAAPAAARRRRRWRGRKVAILGGGVAGLTAAHELVERGFNVVVYERKALGGKARSMPYRGTGRGGRRDLPGEHGFRFFPGFYQHVPDTMRRIPYPGNENGVFDNLVAALQTVFSRSNGRPDFILPPVPRSNGDPYELEQTTLAALYEGTTIPPQESSFFARQFAMFLTSSEERRLGQWEYTSWWDYVR